jgi:hypothetical protein
MEPHTMMRRGIVLALVALLVGQTGCAGGAQVVTREDLIRPKPAKSYTVTTVDGATHTFIALHVEGDWLEGTARTTTTQTVGTGEEAREAVSNRYEAMRIPWAEVLEVEADYGSDAKGGVLLAAASILAGVGAFLLLTSEDPPDDGGGNGGKGF